MTKTKVLLLTLLGLGLTACADKRSKCADGEVSHCATTSAPEGVGYRVAKGYFVAADSVPRVIKSQAELERYLGMAPTMDERPTEVDWGREFVIALTHPETQHATEMAVKDLYTEGDTLHVRYEVRMSQEVRSFFIRPLMALIVPRTYEGYKQEISADIQISELNDEN